MTVQHKELQWFKESPDVASYATKICSYCVKRHIELLTHRLTNTAKVEPDKVKELTLSVQSMKKNELSLIQNVCTLHSLSNLMSS